MANSVARVLAPILLAVAATAACATNAYLTACSPWSTLGCDPLGPTDPAEVAGVVLLVGDGGVVNENSMRVVAHLRAEVERSIASGAATTVLFLGDNVYETGLPDPSSMDREDGVRRIESQINVVRNLDARGIFVPGNHDWGDDPGDVGVARLGNLGSYLQRSNANVALLPEAGCPGPDVVDLAIQNGTRVARLVLLDTHWWLQADQGIKGGSSRCRDANKDKVIADLRRGIAEAPDVPIIVAGHHPLRSGGSHGGNVGLPRSIVTRAGILIQDLNAGPYRDLIRRVDSVFAGIERPIVYAAGHEHTLQVIADTTDRYPVYHLVSGTGSKISNVDATRGTRMAAGLPGYMRLEILHGGRVRLRVVAGCPSWDIDHPICPIGVSDSFETVYSADLY